MAVLKSRYNSSQPSRRPRYGSMHGAKASPTSNQRIRIPLQPAYFLHRVQVRLRAGALAGGLLATTSQATNDTKGWAGGICPGRRLRYGCHKIGPVTKYCLRRRSYKRQIRVERCRSFNGRDLAHVCFCSETDGQVQALVVTASGGQGRQSHAMARAPDPSLATSYGGSTSQILLKRWCNVLFFYFRFSCCRSILEMRWRYCCL